MGIPIVSVIIPVHNSAGSIVECLDSVFGQSYSAIEVIVIDDGSTDKTWDVISKYPQKITTIKQENLGQGAARNAGILAASGDYISLLDADDFWLSEFLTTTVSFLERHPAAVAVSCSFKIDPMSKDIYPVLDASDFEPKERVLTDFFSFWGKYDHMRTGTCLIRKTVVDRAGGQLADLRIGQDLEYWAYLATFGDFGFIRDVLWVGNSRSNAARSGWWKRYATRRRMCPTIEQWQRRVFPKLNDGQIDGYLRVRGRVATNYVHSMILSGRLKDARVEFSKYQSDLPATLLYKLASIGNKAGVIGWYLICFILNVRERCKSLKLQILANR